MSRKELASWTGFYIDGNLICGPRAGYLPIPPPPAPKPEPTPEEVAAARKKAERAAKRKRAREAWREELNGGPRRPAARLRDRRDHAYLRGSQRAFPWCGRGEDRVARSRAGGGQGAWNRHSGL